MKLRPRELTNLIKTFPGQISGGGNQGESLNISKLYDQQFNVMQQNAYNQVDVSNKYDVNDVQDNMAFLGRSKWYRNRDIQLKPISEDEFIQVWMQENKYTQVFNAIRQIDKDHNGFVTRAELDDILKLNIPSLDKTELFPILNKFCSIQNKILIDYNNFKQWVNTRVSNSNKESLKKLGVGQIVKINSLINKTADPKNERNTTKSSFNPITNLTTTNNDQSIMQK